MNVISLNRSDDAEPKWPDVGLHGCDFRPHFDGWLYNLFTTIHPAKTKSDTEQLFRNVAIELANWVLANRERFGMEDRFQIIVGWPSEVRPTGRRVIKTGGDCDTIERLICEPELIQVREGWSKSVFANPEFEDPENG